MNIYTIRSIAAADLVDAAKSDAWRDELNKVAEDLAALRFHAVPQLMTCGDHLVCVVSVSRRAALTGPNGQPMFEPVSIAEVQKRLAEAAAFPPPHLN